MNAERRIRIGDWLIPYDDATQEVVIERSLKDVLTATPGDHLDCMNSRCIRAQRNRHVFPHPVYVVSTIKSVVYVVDRLDDAGLPSHAIRYQLTPRDRRMIDTHDRFGAGEPGQLRLRIPKDPKGSPKRRANGGKRFADERGDKKPEPRKIRPVTAHSLGAKARYVAAVGAMTESSESPRNDPS